MSTFNVFRIIERSLDEGNAEKHSFRTEKLKSFRTMEKAIAFIGKQLVVIITPRSGGGPHTYLARPSDVVRTNYDTVLVGKDIRFDDDDDPIEEIYCETLVHYAIEEVKDLVYPFDSPRDNSELMS